MLDKILKNKLYLGLSIGGIAVIIAAIILVCVFTCGGSDNAGAKGSDVPAAEPLFEFEVNMTEEEGETYPVSYISTSDFEKLMEAENRFAVAELFTENFEPYGAVFHYVNEVNISGTDVITMSSKTGMYLEKGDNVYDINYSNCAHYVYDIDGDGEDELIFYTCEVNNERTRYVCTYYVLGTERNDISWCRYNRAWAVGSSKTVMSGSDISGTDLEGIELTPVETAMENGEVFLVSLMLPGVDHEVYGQLLCDTTGDEPLYYIDAGDYTDLLQRLDGLDK